MLFKIYSVYDSKIEAYMPPLFLRSHGEAIRMFESAVLSVDHQFAKNPEDYCLFYLGTWDDIKALSEMLLTPQPLAKANEVIARQASAA